jgi:hypothetical protein
MSEKALTQIDKLFNFVVFRVNLKRTEPQYFSSFLEFISFSA